MYILQSSGVIIDTINQAAFLLSLFVIGIFYPAYQKCVQEIEKEEMLDQFLKDK